MKKVWFIIVGIFVVIAVAAVYLMLSGKKASSPQNDSPQATQTPSANTETKIQEQPNPTPGAYIAYSAEGVAKTQGRKILFFHAPWCPQCRELEKSITAESIPQNLTIFKVDYDSNTALRQKYGVTLQTTLVEIDSSGNEVQKHVAYNAPTLPAVIRAMKL